MIFKERKTKTLLIGTCRIKKMMAHIDNLSLRKQIVQVSTHVHYCKEIKQMICLLKI